MIEIDDALDDALEQPEGDPTPSDQLEARITGEVPGQGQLGPQVERFDETVDSALERVRGNTAVDAVFTTASHVGDFSMIWHACNLAIGVRERSFRKILTFAVLIGLESLVVNQGVKRLFKRTRPTTTGDDELKVRKPKTSSFPSGHSSAAVFAAGMLIPRVGGFGRPAIAVAAATVATSRAYVRIHHASDVVAGIITGTALLAITRSLMSRFGGDRLI